MRQFDLNMQDTQIRQGKRVHHFAALRCRTPLQNCHGPHRGRRPKPADAKALFPPTGHKNDDA